MDVCQKLLVEASNSKPDKVLILTESKGIMSISVNGALKDMVLMLNFAERKINRLLNEHEDKCQIKDEIEI